MKNLKVMLTLFGVIILTACGGNETESLEDDNDGSQDELQVVSSFSILSDIVNHIGENQVDVYNVVPIGTDPHEHEILPEDTQQATDADLLFHGGMNLEGGDNGWFARLIETVEQDSEAITTAMEGVEPQYIEDEDGRDEVNPHAFLDPNVGITMTENVRDALIDADPDNADVYEENANDYIDELENMDEEYEEKIADIPDEHRVLVTSERAYQYIANRYGLEEGFIFAIDTDEQGTPNRISSLVSFIEDRDVPALFVESNVDPRPMETVSDETGVDIAGTLFSDELAVEGEEGDTYLEFLQVNIDTIHDGLNE